MTPERLSEVLQLCDAGEAADDGFREFGAKTTVTLYVTHGSATLVAGGIEALAHKGGEVRARSAKGEVWFLNLEDIFAASVDGKVTSKTQRKAGFA
jgi:hypothetical protein